MQTPQSLCRNILKLTGALIQEELMPFYVELLIEVKKQNSSRRKYIDLDRM